MSSTLKDRLNPPPEVQVSIRVTPEHAERADNLRDFVREMPELDGKLSRRGVTRPTVMRLALERGMDQMSAIQESPATNSSFPLLVLHQDQVERAAELAQVLQTPPQPTRDWPRGWRTLSMFIAMEMGLSLLEESANRWMDTPEAIGRNPEGI